MYFFKPSLFSRVYNHKLRFVGETSGKLFLDPAKNMFFVLIDRVPSISGDVTALTWSYSIMDDTYLKVDVIHIQWTSPDVTYCDFFDAQI